VTVVTNDRNIQRSKTFYLTKRIQNENINQRSPKN